jgi:outer membrane lipoprotein-sorting protein
MLTNIIYRIIICSVVVCLSTITGCSYNKLSCPALPSLTNPKNYLNNIFESDNKLSQASGTAKLKISSLNKNLSTKNILFLKKPHFIRIESLNFFSQPILFFVCDGQKITIYDPSKNNLYIGDATEKNISSILGINLNIIKVVQFFLGFPPVVNLDESKIKWEQDGNYYFFDICAGTDVHLLWIDPNTKRIAKYKLFNNGTNKLDCSFSEFKSYGELLFPAKMELNLDNYQTKIVIDYDSINLDAFPMELFKFTSPPQANILPLDSINQDSK